MKDMTMTQLVFKTNDDKVVTNSRLVADRFDKNHQHIMRSIREIIDVGDVSNSGQMFLETTYTDNYGREQPMYVINRDGFTLLVMGFTGERALKFKMDFLNAFNLMETALNSDDYIISRAMGVLNKRLAVSEKRIKELEPKALFADSVSSSKDSVLIGELAKILNQNGVKLGQNRLFGWLRENGFLISRGEQRNLPTQRYIEQGLFEIKKTTVNLPEGATIINSTTKVTGKGQIYFVNKFLKEVGLITAETTVK